MENLSPQLQLLKSAIGKKLERTPSAAGNWLAGTLLEADYDQIKVAY